MELKTGEELRPSERTRVKRFAGRGHYDRTTINQILDAAPLAHIGFDHDGPAILPMVFWRIDDHVYFHGSKRNRMFASLSASKQCCFVASLFDGFVLARAALHHSMNYRSVVIYGEAEEITEGGAKLNALKRLIGRFYPGRWEQIRPPSPAEFETVRVFRLPIEEASAKVRTGFPVPFEQDFGMPVWAGIIPVGITLGHPQLDPHSPPDTPAQDLSHLATMLGASIES